MVFWEYIAGDNNGSLKQIELFHFLLHYCCIFYRLCDYVLPDTCAKIRPFRVFLVESDLLKTDHEKEGLGNRYR